MYGRFHADGADGESAGRAAEHKAILFPETRFLKPDLPAGGADAAQPDNPVAGLNAVKCGPRQHHAEVRVRRVEEHRRCPLDVRRPGKTRPHLGHLVNVGKEIPVVAQPPLPCRVAVAVPLALVEKDTRLGKSGGIGELLKPKPANRGEHLSATERDVPCISVSGGQAPGASRKSHALAAEVIAA